MAATYSARRAHRRAVSFSSIKLRTLNSEFTPGYAPATARTPCDQRYAAPVDIWAASRLAFSIFFFFWRTLLSANTRQRRGVTG